MALISVLNYCISISNNYFFLLFAIRLCNKYIRITKLYDLTLNVLIKTAKQRTITLAVDGWAVTFGTARGLGGLRPRSLYQI